MSVASAINNFGLADVSDRTPNKFSAMSSDEFIKIMITELTQQDPLKPSDTSAILEQLSSLRNIESQLSLQERLEALVLQNGISAASGMIGKLVEGLDERNNRVQGLVTSVRVQNKRTYLELDNGWTLPVERVTRVGAAME